MKTLNSFRAALAQALPKVRIVEEAPANPRGVWFLNISLGKRTAMTQWKVGKGFGVARSKEYNYGEGPHEVYLRSADAAARVADLLLSNEFTQPLPEAPPKVKARRTLRRTVVETGVIKAQKH